MMEDTRDQVKQTVATLFNVDERSLTDETSPLTLPEWDSMGQLMLILELEQQFDMQIGPEVAEKLTNIAAIVKLVQETA
jgi:acyl carrier protein